MHNEHTPRINAENYLVDQQAIMILETCGEAARDFADTQNLDIGDALRTGRPLTVEVGRPVGDKHFEYLFSAELDRYGSDQDGELSGLMYTLRRIESDVTPFAQLTEYQQQNLMMRVEELSGSYDDETNELLSDIDESTECTMNYVEEYSCSHDCLTIEKNTSVDYYIGTLRVMSMGDDLDDEFEDDSVTEPVDDQLIDAAEEEMMSVVADDFDRMREILYYLNLTGGELVEDVTPHDPREV